MARGAKPVQRQARRRHVAKRLRDGKKYTFIHEEVMARFGVSPATASRDLADVQRELAATFERYRSVAALDILNDLLKTRVIVEPAGRSKGDPRTRVQVNRALMKLFGLEKVDLNVNGTIDVEAAIQARLAALRPDLSKLTREEREQLRPVLHLFAKITGAKVETGEGESERQDSPTGQHTSDAGDKTDG